MYATGQTAKVYRRDYDDRGYWPGVESGEQGSALSRKQAVRNRHVYFSVVQQWHFVENESRPGRWRWQLLTSDDEIQSKEFNSYGDAVAHAIRQGFRPSEDKWVVVALHTIARFNPKKTPVTTSNWPERKVS